PPEPSQPPMPSSTAPSVRVKSPFSVNVPGGPATGFPSTVTLLVPLSELVAYQVPPTSAAPATAPMRSVVRVRRVLGFPAAATGSGGAAGIGGTSGTTGLGVELVVVGWL